MQIERLFSIIYKLMGQKTVTAAELAACFEVSVRTIYRDIDILARAGIPVYASKGRGGGIALTDNYVLNKSLITESEQKEILYALKSMNSVSFARTDSVLSKLSSLFQSDGVEDWIEIDFSSWSHQEGYDFHLLKTAILEKRVIEFSYYNTAGEISRREVEPQRLWFKHRSWYLKGYCRMKNDMRLFKVTRIRKLLLTDKLFNDNLPKMQPVVKLAENKQRQIIRLKLRIDASQAFRVYDEFDDDMFTIADDGSFIVDVQYPEDEWVYGFILGFGHYAQVLEPEHIRVIIHQRICEMEKQYRASPLEKACETERVRYAMP